MFSQAIEPLTPGEAYLEQAVSGADQLAAEAITSARAAYESDFRDFTAWCSEFGLDPLPATPDTVRAYLASLAREKHKASTIRRRRAAIAATHRQAGHESPTSSEAVKVLSSGINRAIGTATRQATPLTADILAKVIAAIDLSTKRGLRGRAMLAIGFAGAFRRSELVGIDLEHIARHREGIVVTLPQSKTDQEGTGQSVPIPKGREIRPVAALDAWIQAAGITTGPIFRHVDKSGQVQLGRLSAQGFVNMLKERLAAAGFDPQFSGHSLRAGFVTSALKSGADVSRRPIRAAGSASTRCAATTAAPSS